jgi:hypothetical protein
MQPPRRPSRITPAQAQVGYAHAKQQLLAAEEAYARALLILKQAQATSQAVLPLPHRQRHFLCGHERMEYSTEEGDQEFSFCPTCRISQEYTPADFTARRTLLVRTPQPDDPA